MGISDAIFIYLSWSISIDFMYVAGDTTLSFSSSGQVLHLSDFDFCFMITPYTVG